MQGPILAFVYAVKELLGEGRPGAAGPGGSLPCNVVFVVEGEEENGSAGFRDVRLSMTFAKTSLGNCVPNAPSAQRSLQSTASLCMATAD